MPRHAEIIGKRFERLVVIELARTKWDGNRERRVYRCQCDCGNSIEAIYGRLANGNTRSCGCLKLDRQTTHGESKTAVYAVWRAMHERCMRPANRNYENYGARGITVCERWKDYVAFRDDMGPRPRGGTLERNNVNGNYEPSNCCWASVKQQQNNRRDNHKVTFRGTTKTLAEWAIELGIARSRIDYRLKKGWSVEEAFTKPWSRGERRDLRPARTI